MLTEMKPCGPEISGDPLPYEMSYLTEELRKKAKAELFEDEDTRIHSLRLLRTMLAEEHGLFWLDEDLYLLGFLRARKFDVKRAFNLMKTFYTVVGKHVELYHNFNFADVRRTLSECRIGFLPYRDHEGCPILLFSTKDWDPCRHPLSDVMRVLTTGLIHANLSPATQIAGFKVIVDWDGFSLKELPHITPKYLWLFAEALQNCFPGRFKAVHHVNENYLFSYIWVILKQLLGKKLRDRFHFHGKNVTKLHKYFPRSILPAEYEGDLPPFDNTEWTRKLEQVSEYLTYVYTFGYKKRKKNKVQESLTHQN